MPSILLSSLDVASSPVPKQLAMSPAATTTGSPVSFSEEAFCDVKFSKVQPTKAVTGTRAANVSNSTLPVLASAVIARREPKLVKGFGKSTKSSL